jgi:CcmD family protein
MIHNPYLFAAYSATWIIHFAYLATLVRRYSRLKREARDLHKPTSPEHQV